MMDEPSFDDKYKAIVDIVERGGDHRTMRSVLETMCDTNILTQYEAFEIDTKYKLEKENK